MGLALCKPDPAEKKPTYPRWGTYSKEAADFQFGDMIGIIGGPLSDGNKPGHALVVVDLDTAAAVAQADEFLPVTAMEEGREGKPRSHRYYLIPVASIPSWAESRAPQAATTAKEMFGHSGPFKKSFQHADTNKTAIDFIGTGGQANCPPSLHAASGEQREWTGGGPGEPTVVEFENLWLAVCRLAESCGCKPASGCSFPWKDRPPLPRIASTARTSRRTEKPESRAIAYLAKIPGAISGNCGHQQTFSAARAIVFGFDLGPKVGFQILKEHYNQRCQPEWSDQELWHKAHDADLLPYRKQRGWLLNEMCNPGDSTNRSGTSVPMSKINALAEPSTGVVVILDYFRNRYRPVFRRGNSIHCEDGADVPMGVACALPDSDLIERLATTTDAPRTSESHVKRHALPGFFKNWAKVAWGDLLKSLPDEDNAPRGAEGLVKEEFRRLVREAMLTEVVLGDIVRQPNAATQIERRSLISWCQLFAKIGPWKSIRSKLCWCKLKELPGGELVLMVAIRHELFSQLRADRRLCDIGTKKFTLRASRYGVGESTRNNRPEGQAGVVLANEFVADLTSSLPADEPPTEEESETE